MQITQIRAAFPERQGFCLVRPDSGNEYIFIHFLTPARLTLRGKEQAVESGACIFFAPHSDHVLSAPDVPLLHDWFHLSGDLSPLLSAFGLSPETLYYPVTDGFITPLVERMEVEHTVARPFQREIVAAHLTELIAGIARALMEKAPEPPSAELRASLVSARRRIHTEYAAPWTVPQMAALVGLSPSRFFAVYSGVFGVSPKHDLNAVRLQHAYRLLEAGGAVRGACGG